jgi:hypothetical protein
MKNTYDTDCNIIKMTITDYDNNVRIIDGDIIPTELTLLIRNQGVKSIEITLK